MAKGLNLMKKPIQWWLFVIISGIGILNALYLTILKVSENKNLCLQGVGDCWSVNTSVYSQVFGIPVSLIGLIGFLVILVIYLCENKLDFLQKYAKYLIFGFSLLGVLYSAYLTYIEFFVIQAVCPFCLLSAVSMLALFILSVLRLAQDPDTIKEEEEKDAAN